MSWKHAALYDETESLSSEKLQKPCFCCPTQPEQGALGLGPTCTCSCNPCKRDSRYSTCGACTPVFCQCCVVCACVLVFAGGHGRLPAEVGIQDGAGRLFVQVEGQATIAALKSAIRRRNGVTADKCKRWVSCGQERKGDSKTLRACGITRRIVVLVRRGATPVCSRGRSAQAGQ